MRQGRSSQLQCSIWHGRGKDEEEEEKRRKRRRRRSLQ
jgi:hypothetical protein